MLKFIYINIVFILCLFYCGCDLKSNTVDRSEPVPESTVAEESKARLLLDEALELVYRPGENKTDLDSAILLVKQCEALNQFLKSDEVRARAYFVYSNAYRESGMLAEGSRYIQKSVEIYKKTGAEAGLAEAYLEMIQYHGEDDGEYNRQTTLYKLADSLFVKAGLEERHAFMLKNLGDLEFAEWNFSKALLYLKECESVYNKINYKELQGVYDLLGASYTGLGDYNNGVKYGLMALRTAENVADTSIQLSTIYNRLGQSYYKSKKFEEAAFYFGKALDIATKYKSHNDVLVISVNLNVALLVLNRWQQSIDLVHSTEKNFKPASLYDSVTIFTFYATAFVTAKKYDLAKKYVSLLEGLIEHGGGYEGIFLNAYSPLVNYFIGIHQYDKAQASLAAKYKLYEIPSLRADLISYYKLKYTLDSAKADFKSAFGSLSIYKHITDSVFNEKQGQQLAQIQVQYETEEKDNDIKMLTKQAELKDAQLRQERLARNVFITGAIMLALLLGLAYNRYRLKQRVNKQLELQQSQINQQNHLLQSSVEEKEKLLEEKEWLVKEIHHRVKNNLQIVISLLNTQAFHLEEGDALTAIQESRHRMQVISLLHQKLYQAETSSLINMQAYIREVVNYLKESFQRINHLFFEQHIELINLDISQAVPVGLILNEAVTNCIKYAFPGNSTGNITVSFTKQKEGHLQLTIADNGIGIDTSIDPAKRKSLGMQLMQTLSEQLDGNMKIENKGGTVVKVCFVQQATGKLPAGSEGNYSI